MVLQGRQGKLTRGFRSERRSTAAAVFHSEKKPQEINQQLKLYFTICCYPLYTSSPIESSAVSSSKMCTLLVTVNLLDRLAMQLKTYRLKTSYRSSPICQLVIKNLLAEALRSVHWIGYAGIFWGLKGRADAKKFHGGNSYRAFELFIMISNTYEPLKKNYDVVFNNTFRKKEMNRVQCNFFLINFFLIFKNYFKNL
jgi:hypothetical protein